MATSSRTRLALVAALLAGAAVAAVTAIATGSPAAGGSREVVPPGRARATTAFPVLHPGPAPAGWRVAALPGGAAELAYPPGMHLVAGDTGSVSAARLGPHGQYLLYLNATPHEGTESLANWRTYRIRLLTSDDASSARLLAASTGVRFRGGTGSCVLDTYRTRIGAHHFEELACLVRGTSTETVVVAAAPASRWAASAGPLERAIGAFAVR